jgi:hypothetical protein
MNSDGLHQLPACRGFIIIVFIHKNIVCVGGHKVMFVHHYTPTVKALEEWVPPFAKPNLLTYLLGTGYLGSSRRLAKVWQEVKKREQGLSWRRLQTHASS